MFFTSQVNLDQTPKQFSVVQVIIDIFLVKCNMSVCLSVCLGVSYLTDSPRSSWRSARKESSWLAVRHLLRRISNSSSSSVLSKVHLVLFSLSRQLLKIIFRKKKEKIARCFCSRAVQISVGKPCWALSLFIVFVRASTKWNYRDKARKDLFNAFVLSSEELLCLRCQLSSDRCWIPSVDIDRNRCSRQEKGIFLV